MRIAIVIGLGLAAVAQAGKLPPPMKMNLIQASCVSLQTGNGVPCSSTFTFTAGQVVMKSLKQPQPTCPKTGKPTEAPGGTITMKGVTKSGAPFTGSLDAQVFFKTTFGADPTGNCELANLSTGNFLSLTGTVECKNGKCKGTVYPIACLSPQCADTPIFSEFGSVKVEATGQSFGPIVVFDDAGNPLATPGSALAGGAKP
jgi:hypothetical protein